MEYFTNPDMIRNEINLPFDVIDQKILPHIEKAAAEIQRIITPQIYTDIMEETGNEYTENAKADITAAESSLAISYLLPALNIQTTGGGIIKVKGWDLNRMESFSFSEIMSLAEKFKKHAYQILDFYKPVIPNTASEDEDDDYLFSSGFSISTI